MIVLLFYLVIGGRVYCSWVCPVNPIIDLAEWLRQRLHITGGAHFSPNARYWLLGAIMLFAAGGILYLVFQDIAPQARLARHWGPPLGAVFGFALGLLGTMLVQG